ncbi:protein FD-like [Mangifera indica]|uniref:protein FD-like n=1 Tax=Mangifera indica TaxID=29780 RepID=UPI001CF9B339|nr:protein FD-like [Mangifera indica]
MWPSASRNNNTSCSRSPSKSKSTSSTCSSPAPFSPSYSSPTRTTMEEVWRDISLSSLDDHSNSILSNNINKYSNNRRSNYPSLILQDFLARPFNNDPSPRRPSSEPSFPLKSPLATMLSLNSGSACSDVQHPESGSCPARPNQKLNGHHSSGTCSLGCSHNSVLDATGSPTVFPPYCKKRVSEKDEYSEERRHKRMIKNRESAARSRARKQESFCPFSLSFKFSFCVCG